MKTQNAIIIGSSMAGLLAAAVCARHFDEVLVLEKDRLPEDRAAHRKGVPQDHHLHILLSRGFRILQSYFPDLKSELIELGAIRGDIGHLLRWHAEGGFRPNCDTGLETLMLSRALLEHTVRRHLQSRENIRILDRKRIEALEYSAAHKRITGVRADREQMAADLVIDATGCGGRMLTQLENLGFRKPKLERVKVGVQYTSCLFPRDPGFTTLLNINSQPPQNSRHGSIQPIEGNRMIVTVQGRANDQLPEDVADFKAYTRQLMHPALAETIADLEPLSDIHHYKVKHTEWWHYEDLRDFPQGYLPIGDAICRLNPVYGQGMTSAAMQAEILDQLLAGGKPVLWKRYFKKIAGMLKGPWEATVMEDFKFDTTEGIPPKLPGFVKSYFTHLNRVMNHNPHIFKAFARVLNLEAAPESLFSPVVAWYVWREWRQGR